MDGGKLANAALHYGFRSADGVFISTLDRKNWSGFAGLAAGLAVKKAVLPYGPLPDELEEALAAYRKGGGTVVRAWAGDELQVSGMAVRAAWREGSSGYGGNTGYEGLDWTFSCAEFAVAVEDDGRRASLTRGAAGERRGSEAKKGEVLELEL